MRKSKSDELSLTTVLFIGAASGLGFGIAESLNYSAFYSATEQPLHAYVLRFLSAAWGHGVYTAATSAVLFQCRAALKDGSRLSFDHALGLLLLLALVALPVAFIHAVYNTVSPLLGMALDFTLALRLALWLSTQR